MRPGQLEPNEFELAILERMANKAPLIRAFVQKLRVLSREFTGVGSYTTFLSDEPSSEHDEAHISLDALISMPRVPNGMGAVLFVEGGKPKLLETFTYGDDHWDGVYEGFSIDEAA